MRWICQDVYGGTTSAELSSANGNVLYNPPYVHHTYEALDPNSSLTVVANTLFDPDDPRTQDSYRSDVFVQLQEQAQSGRA